jgi:hypothetical protein
MFEKHVLKFVFKAKQVRKIDSEFFNQGKNRNIRGEKESGWEKKNPLQPTFKGDF